MKDELDALLSRGRLSGAERERILDDVLDAVAPAPAPKPRRKVVIAWVAASGLALAAGAVLLLRERTQPQEFAARGDLPMGARVGVVCLGGTLASCPHGSRLAFSASGLAKQGYLNAYAEPEGAGERIWYFSSENESPAIGPTSSSEEPVGRVIMLGGEHAPGRYSLHVSVSDRELRRAEILRPPPGSILASTTVRLQVVP